MSVMIRAAKEGERGTCSRIIKVNHAGEFGAVNIYRAQLMASLLGRSGIMACTAAVETVVTGHLVEQLVFLESQGDMEAAAAVQSIVSEEEEHKAVGIAQGKDSPLFKPLGAVVAAATSFVIWLGMKL